MNAGCIPVIISDNYQLPFSEKIDWNSCSIKIKEDELDNILNIIKDNLSRENCKNWDSLNFLTLISNLEKKFKIKFNYKEMIMLDSYKNIIKVLNKKIKK